MFTEVIGNEFSLCTMYTVHSYKIIEILTQQGVVIIWTRQADSNPMRAIASGLKTLRELTKRGLDSAFSSANAGLAERVIEPTR